MAAETTKITYSSKTAGGRGGDVTIANGYGGGYSDYQSSIGSRSSYGTDSVRSGGTRSLKVVTESGGHSLNGILSPAMSANAASAIVESREREKKDLAKLNDRLANYIEKVRFLEAQNRKLAGDLDLLRGSWGKDTSSIKETYEIELAQARKLLDDTTKSKNGIEGQIRSLQTDLADLKKRYGDILRARDGDREKLDGLVHQLGETEAELSVQRRRATFNDDEIARLKKELARVQNDYQRSRTDLESEIVTRIDFQNQAQSFAEEIEFLRRIHDQELSELQSLVTKDSTAENREFFKNELALAIRDIRHEYEKNGTQSRADLESWYKLKIQEVQTASSRITQESGHQKDETKRLRGQLNDMRAKLGGLESKNASLEKQVDALLYQIEDDERSYESEINERDAQIRKMRDECQALMVELQTLLETKQTLDAEIAIYRTMLDGEENRNEKRELAQKVKGHGHSNEYGIREIVTTSETFTSASSRSDKQGGSAGVAVTEDPSGRYIILENTNLTQEEDLSHWKLKRKFENGKELIFNFPASFYLKPARSVKIWARNNGGTHSPTESLVFEGAENWGTGSNIQTTLINSHGLRSVRVVAK